MREQIIAEIKRIASETGDKAPGRQTFERATGISESVWRGVYWARWGDALVAAGFSANEKTTKLGQDFMLQKIAEAFRHFGKTPTLIELRMYRQTDQDFPSHSTLSNHFPEKEQLIEAVRAWTALRPDFADVATMLPATQPQKPLVHEAIRARTEGHVYLIQSGEFYKIGRSDELERRVKEIRIALPDKAVLAHSIKTDDPPGIEAYWHRRFADRRANGEWFRLTSNDVAAFRRRKFQ